MYAMQYEFTLPADFDMSGLAEKVRAAVHLTDDFQGLGLKAYMFCHRERDGAPVNQYSSFYLWHDVRAMSRFLWGGGPFHRIVAYFGRPIVRHWTGAAFERGAGFEAVPLAATRSLTAIAPDIDPAPVVARAAAGLAALSRTDGVHSAALAIDPQRWELLNFTMWAKAPPAEVVGQRYQVFHLSKPHMAALPTGHHW